jgi:hypothetical protein
VSLAEIAEAAITLSAHAWCASADHDGLKVAAMKSLKTALKESLKTISG